MKKLFENWNKYKNKTEELEEGIEQIADQMTPENFGYALQALQKVAANFAPAVVGTLLFAALTKYREDKKEKEATTDLNESIGVDTEKLLRTAVEKAYKDMVASHHPEQIYADTGESVDPDPAAVARAQIVGLVASYIEEMSEPEEHLAGAEGL